MDNKISVDVTASNCRFYCPPWANHSAPKNDHQLMRRIDTIYRCKYMLNQAGWWF